jgi:hypothetical protein
MVILLALLLLACPAGAETLRVSMGAPEGAGLPSAAGLAAAVQRLFSAEFGRAATLSFDPAAAADAVAQVSIVSRNGTTTVSTSLTAGAVKSSLASTIARPSPGGIASTVCADLAYLLFSVRGFTAFALGPPPSMTALLPTDLLARLLPGTPDQLEPVAIAPSGTGVILCFAHGYLTLGPLFSIEADTARDVIMQAGGREPLQLSGAVPGSDGELYLLSERSARIVALDPRVGSRAAVDAPGLSGLTARVLDSDTIAVLSDSRGSAGITLYPLGGGAPRLLSVGGGYLSAFSVDREGNIWTWDLTERRIRVVTREGREVSSIRPLFRASVMPVPQQLEVFDDGSFLLGGSGELWKFSRTGIPEWRLTRIPGKAAEQLPASFSLAAEPSGASFTILDEQSRRLTSFSNSPSGSGLVLASHYRTMDPRSAGDLSAGAQTAASAGLSLLALSFTTQLAARTPSPAALARAGLQVARDEAGRAAELADALSRDLLTARAREAWNGAAQAVRSVLALAPDDRDMADLAERIAARSKEAEESLTPGSELRLVSASVIPTSRARCVPGLTVRLRVRNDGPVALAQLRLHVNLPEASSGPALAALDILSPGEERNVDVPLAVGPAGPGGPGSNIPLAVYAEWTRRNEGDTASFLLKTPVQTASVPLPAAAALACAAAGRDALIDALPDELLGVPAKPRNPLAVLATVLDMLGSLRAPAGAETSVRSPSGTVPPVRSPRAVLRALDPSDTEWLLVTASVAESLGLSAGLLSWDDTTFVLVDTGMPLATALAQFPGLEAWARVLTSLSRSGALCIPLSGAVGTTAEELAAALAYCGRRGLDGSAVAWIPETDRNPPASGPEGAGPLPMVVPAVAPAEVSFDALVAQVGQAVADVQPDTP